MSKLSQFLNSWKYHRTQTIDLLKATPEDKLTFSPSDALGSLSKQFRHLANIQHCYIEAIKTQKTKINISRNGLKAATKIFCPVFSTGITPFEIWIE